MSSKDFNKRFTVITGPSGVGKGTVVSKLLKRNKELWLSISSTTRSPREGEKNGIQYFFLDENEFKSLIHKDGFLEWAKFAGNFYGTPKKPVEEKLLDGFRVLLEIELEGARQVRKSFPEGFQIFLSPPSIEELESRIRGRATNTERDIQNRLFRAKEEMAAKDEFDAIVINDQIDQSVLEIEKLIGI